MNSNNHLQFGRYFLPFFILIGFIFSYLSTLKWMVSRFSSDESYYSHGFLVPFIILFIIYQNKDSIVENLYQSSTFGFCLIIFSQLINISGKILYIQSLSGISIFIFFFGLSLFLGGWGLSKILFFPLFFLLFMLPMPEAMISSISNPLKEIVTDIGVSFIRTIGVPIFRESFSIFLPNGQLVVGDPCSGLRSIISLLALGLLYLYFSRDDSFWINIFLLFSIIPVAVFTNILRVSFLIFASYRWGTDSVSPDTIMHNISGMLIFLFSLIILHFFKKLLICLN